MAQFYYDYDYHNPLPAIMPQEDLSVTQFEDDSCDDYDDYNKYTLKEKFFPQYDNFSSENSTHACTYNFKVTDSLMLKADPKLKYSSSEAQCIDDHMNMPDELDPDLPFFGGQRFEFILPNHKDRLSGHQL